MRVSVILVNFNGEPFVYEALESLAQQSFKDFETIVVDNGSTDGSSDRIRVRFPWVRLIELSENKGFAYACAEGFRQGRGEDIAVLNNDAVADTNWLKEMVSLMDSDDRLGMVACKVINNKTKELESAGIFPARNGMVFLFKPENIERTQEVFGACGVAGLYRGKMLRELGFYPEDFFIYYEDADLAYRARRAGWKAFYCPEAKVFHLGSETTSGMGIKDYYLPRNKLRTIVRNWDFELIVKYLPWILFYELASFFGAIFSGKFQGLKARMDFLRLFSVDFKVRKRHFSQTAAGFNLEKWIRKSYPGLSSLWRSRN